MNLDQGRYELSHSSCSTFAHDRGKNNAPDRLQKKARAFPPPAYYGYLVLSCNPTTTQEDSSSLCDRRDLLGARKHLRNGMGGRDGEGGLRM